MGDPKRHHYIPITYLDSFSDLDEMVTVYRKDDPDRSFRSKPSNVGFEKYYYSQTSDDGVRDNSRMEIIFGEVESKWPRALDDIRARTDGRKSVETLYSFIALLRARGPAVRDAVEIALGKGVLTDLKIIHKAGLLPPLPKSHGSLLDNIVVSIDPHRSLRGMPHIMNGVGKVLQTLGYEVIHNLTCIPFITSDNPVVYFSPNAQNDATYPYDVTEGRPIEFLFPLTSTMLLRGHTDWRPWTNRHGLHHVETCDRQFIKRANRLVAKFAYRFVFAQDSSFATLVKKYAALSPVMQMDIVPNPMGGSFEFGQMIFGPRPAKPRWRGAS